jgi:diadenosine tetraphosphate (Ap4A) HIT family hydrolase
MQRQPEWQRRGMPAPDRQQLRQARACPHENPLERNRITMTTLAMTACTMCRRWDDHADLRIIELEHSFVTLNRDQYFPGYTLLFTREHVTELFHLDRQVRAGLMEEVSRVAEALFSVFQPDKINYELLGNMVPHIHWHLVPRRSTDPLWPRPIWSEPHDEILLSPAEYRKRIELIRKTLP